MLAAPIATFLIALLTVYSLYVVLVSRTNNKIPDAAPKYPLYAPIKYVRTMMAIFFSQVHGVSFLAAGLKFNAPSVFSFTSFLSGSKIIKPPKAIKNGTIWVKLDDGSAVNKIAPVIPPKKMITIILNSSFQCPLSSRVEEIHDPTALNISDALLTTLAETAGSPAKYSNAGYDTSDDKPVTVPNIPATIPTGINNKIIQILTPKIVMTSHLFFY